eukprot:COSAG02_NODE_134_length_34593_cov_43.594886_5_plen_204_part_00
MIFRSIPQWYRYSIQGFYSLRARLRRDALSVYQSISVSGSDSRTINGTYQCTGIYHIDSRNLSIGVYGSVLCLDWYFAFWNACCHMSDGYITAVIQDSVIVSVEPVVVSHETAEYCIIGMPQALAKLRYQVVSSGLQLTCKQIGSPIRVIGTSRGKNFQATFTLCMVTLLEQVVVSHESAEYCIIGMPQALAKLRYQAVSSGL